MPHTQFLFSFEQITKLLLVKKSGEGVQGRRKKKFSENNNFLGEKNFRTSTLQLLSSDFTSIFHTNFRYFAQKKQISCPLGGNI
jgi:hypothetical protein